MKKNSLRVYLVLGILFVVYSIIVFVIPFSKNAVFWLAYIFTVIAMAIQIMVFKLSFTIGKGAKSKFYGFPILFVGIVYLIVQIAVGIIEMTLSTIVPLWFFLVLNVLILSVGITGCIVTDAIREEVERQDVKIKKDIEKMRAMQSLLVTEVNQCEDLKIKKQLQKVADEFRYSDPVTCEASTSIELELAELISEIQKTIIDDEHDSAEILCNKVLSLLAERNGICKLNKK